MSEEKNTELLPCPFCGGTDLEVHGKPGILNAHDDVGCNSCSAFTPAPTWNRRSLPVGVPDGIAEQHAKAMRLLHEAHSWIIPKGNISVSIFERIGAFLDSAAPTVKAEQPERLPQEWWQIIRGTLRYYRMSTRGDGEGGGYPLIDAMTADGQSLAGGIKECTYLADAIWNALLEAPSLPAAGSAGVALTGEYHADVNALLAQIAALSAQQSAPERVSVPTLADVDRYRIELLPEHDAGYVAKAYVEESEPVAEASGFTAVEAVREVIALLSGATEGGA